RLEIAYLPKGGSRVQIPPSPPLRGLATDCCKASAWRLLRDGDLHVHPRLLVARDRAVEVVRPGGERHLERRVAAGVDYRRVRLAHPGALDRQVVRQVADVRELEDVAPLRELRRGELDLELALLDLDRLRGAATTAARRRRGRGRRRLPLRLRLLGRLAAVVDDRLEAHLELAGLSDEEFVRRAYRLVLRRDPEPAALERPVPRATLLRELVESDEFRRLAALDDAIAAGRERFLEAPPG